MQESEAQQDSLNSEENQCTDLITLKRKGDLSISGKIDTDDDTICALSNKIPKLINQPFKIRDDTDTCESEVHSFKLSSWGLPESVVKMYESRLIYTLFPWQIECLSNTNVLKNGKNLVCSAPTSAGKTLVAEILALRAIFERKKKVIFISPFVSVVKEKMHYFQDILKGCEGLRIESYARSDMPSISSTSVDFAISTIEKANDLLNILLENDALSGIGTVVIDDIHVLGEVQRGYAFEMLITKLMYIIKKGKHFNIQVVVMSAIIPNLNDLAKCLDADLYMTNFRSTPLYEWVHIDGQIYDKDLKLIRELPPIPELSEDIENIIQLCLEPIQDSGSVLIFCSTKRWCESLSQKIASGFSQIINSSSSSEWGPVLRFQLKTDLLEEVMNQLKDCPDGLDSCLKKTVPFGIAFHHTGLTVGERDVIERNFRNRTLKVIVATSTLYSGVNLPVRRVIIRTTKFLGKPLGTLNYKQMIGRAGRKGLDSFGESFLISESSDCKFMQELMSDSNAIKPLKSCLEGAGTLKRAIVEVVASGIASSLSDVILFTKCTLLALQSERPEDIDNHAEEAVNFLKKNKLIAKSDDKPDQYLVTFLGKACVHASLSPDDGLALFADLKQASKCFILNSELHLIYLVIPYSVYSSWDQIDWYLYLEIWDSIPAFMRGIGTILGVQDSFIIKRMRGRIEVNSADMRHILMIHKRFFLALAMFYLIMGRSLNDVCINFNCSTEPMQSLKQSATVNTRKVAKFSGSLGWNGIEGVFNQLYDRILYMKENELSDLMPLHKLSRPIMRLLYNAEIKTVTELANCDVVKIEKILQKCVRHSEFDKNQKQFNIVWRRKIQCLPERDIAERFIRYAKKYLGSVEKKRETNANILEHTKTTEAGCETNTTDIHSMPSCSTSKADEVVD